MPKICYVERRFSPDSVKLIESANEIIAEYTAAGFSLTLRQLYYQFVARAIIANNERSYKNLGSLINDGRLAGMIDWEAIEDRTRNIRRHSHWDSPGSIVKACSQQYHIDRWAEQMKRVEVWIEKDALVGVIEDVCHELDVTHFSCRGYTSQSEMWSAAQRFGEYLQADQNVVIIHLGDHDPSGIDMSRDIEDRIRLFLEGDGFDNQADSFFFERVALNWDQIQQFKPPPNPAKLSDSRARVYVDRFGDESWELDALDPRTLSDLVREKVTAHMNTKRMKRSINKELGERQQLNDVADNWEVAVEAANDVSPD